ncbi:MAG: tyrosine-type recombinase/integrase [Spirochaetia bacterium]|jgi:integrase/recombinase XerD|nr:tyrosine-type recombinase/integrase [Spirochaetia bacterium]
MAEYKSSYAPFFTSYLEFKRSLGYKMQNTHVFKNLDRFLHERADKSIGFTEDILSVWCERRANEGDRTRYNRIVEVKNFATYLNGLGYPSFIPRLPKRYTSTFKPYIFTHEDLANFFASCDLLDYHANYQSLHHILPSLFRLLYGCGLRISEALSLRCDDVNLTAGCITIHETKNGEERRLPLSDSLRIVLEQYVTHHRNNICGTDYFFVKQNGDKCSRSTVYKKFRIVLFQAGISHGGKGQGPRLHDLRHSFGVHSLARMAEQGLDLYYCLPLLSKYLGHKSLVATDSYVRLTSEMYPRLLDEINRICTFVFPQVFRGDMP